MHGRFIKTFLPVSIERSKNTLERINEAFLSLEMLKDLFICNYLVACLSGGRCMLCGSELALTIILFMVNITLNSGA